jgi:hypothetical protein
LTNMWWNYSLLHKINIFEVAYITDIYHNHDSEKTESPKQLINLLIVG